MNKQVHFIEQTGKILEPEFAFPYPDPTPRPWPPPWPWPRPWPAPNPNPISLASGSYSRGTQEFRLDVDGVYPLMVASGTFFPLPIYRGAWIANLTASEEWPNVWTGAIWYTLALPATYDMVIIWLTGNPPNHEAYVAFDRGMLLYPQRVVVGPFPYRSPFFHSVNFEFDSAEGETATTAVDTCEHPNRPATLPCENLTIQTVFQRAGFDVTTSPGGSVPIAGAGIDAQWSDQEMHDAMQTYWSRFANTAQWAFWTFFASLHEMGTSLGGIMFDDIGPNQRQGCAIFNDSFISNPPPGDANPAAWMQRNLFWTACHEMGHAFNLAHSWQKSWGRPWIPLADEPEARSFMNYPYRVSGGQTAFFADFQFRFSDEELLFLRHAPARFVQPGNADWFDHHGFREANVSPEPALKMELRVNREKLLFEFMEPVILELKLTNISLRPQLIDHNLWSVADSVTVIIKKDGKPARQFVPYAQYCWLPDKKVLMPGESIYEALFIAAGRNGWDMAEPGNYTLQAALHMVEEDIVSNALRLRVLPPSGYDEEVLAQDVFSDDVGRIIAFDGSRFFEGGNNVLREVADKLSDRRVALHANLALGKPLAMNFKELGEAKERKGKEGTLEITVRRARPDEARRLLSAALLSKPTIAVESFGHIDYKWYMDSMSEWLAQEGERDTAAETQEVLYKTMSGRVVNGRPILDSILREIEQKRDGYYQKEGVKLREGNPPKGRKRTLSRKKTKR